MSIARAFAKALHPAGEPRSFIGLGAAAPDWAPAFGENAGAAAGVVVLAPSAGECADAGWLERAVNSASQALASDGVLYAIARRPQRARVARVMRAAGLATVAPFVQFGAGAPTLYVPLTAPALHHAVSAFGLSRRWRWTARLLAHMPGGARLLAAVLPSVGLAATRPGVRPLDWLLGAEGSGTACHAIVATSWRGEGGGAVAMALADRPGPALFVAKHPAPGQADANETAMLDTLGDDARAAGLRVPRALDLALPPGWRAQSPVPGRPMAHLLACGEMEAGAAIERVSAHLEAWSRRTLRYERFSPALRDRVLRPARALGASGAIDGVWLEQLDAASERLLGQDVALVAAHNDCTSANLLVAGDGALSLVDWETAEPAGLPLADFWYAACDMAAAPQCFADRVGAFVSCFMASGRYRGVVGQAEARLRGAVPCPGAWLDLCFHLCWLHHAANEQVTARPGEPCPFLEIVRVLAGAGSPRPLAGPGKIAPAQGN